LLSLDNLKEARISKNSILNAIIGRDLLPTGILPLTSVITVVKYGARERLVIRRKGRRFSEYEPIAALPNYVTGLHNPENRKGIETVAIELPLPFLRRGLQFVDTPGVGSALRPSLRCWIYFYLEGVSEAEIGLDKVFDRRIEVMIPTHDPVIAGFAKESDMGSKPILESTADVRDPSIGAITCFEDTTGSPAKVATTCEAIAKTVKTIVFFI
jgi:Dynamin family